MVVPSAARTAVPQTPNAEAESLQILRFLTDGRAYTAAELARAAAIPRQRVDSCLASWHTEGLLAVHHQGPHRYYHAASPEIFRLSPDIPPAGNPSAPSPKSTIRTGPRDEATRIARSCYGHLAGRLGMALTDTLTARGHVLMSDAVATVTPDGSAFLAAFGVSALPPNPSRKGGAHRFCHPCLDWSERRPHIAGTVGTALLDRLLALDWVRRQNGCRTLAVTAAGRQGLQERFGIVHP